jgi:hypothetical protein
MGDCSLGSNVFIHVLISLLGMGSGLVIHCGFLGNKRIDGSNAFFLVTTILTSLSGFVLPAHKILPSHILGVLSLIALAIACVARYSKKMQGGWRKTYVISAMISFYFNVFVLVVQSFLKVPSLHALAPTGSEAPFTIWQSIALLAFIVLTILAVKKFRATGAIAAQTPLTPGSTLA